MAKGIGGSSTADTGVISQDTTGSSPSTLNTNPISHSSAGTSPVGAASSGSAATSQAAVQMQNTFSNELNDQRNYKKSGVTQKFKYEGIKKAESGSFNNKIVTSGNSDDSNFTTDFTYSFNK